MSSNLGLPIVIDNGTGYTKMGYSSNALPNYVFPTAIGVHPQVAQMKISSDRVNYLEDLDYIIGDEVASKTPGYIINYPVTRGLITNWEYMEKIWQKSFYQYLHCEPSEHPVLLTEPFNNTIENKEYTAEVMFETFNVPYLYLAPQAVLTLYGGSKQETVSMSGCIVDGGEGGTSIVPVADGFVIASAARVLPIGGKDITDFIQKRLRERNEPIPPEDFMDVCRYIKEHYCYIHKDISKEFKKFDDDRTKFIKHSGISSKTKRPYSIDVGYEQFLAPELYFNPEIIAADFTDPLYKVIDNCILKCPIDTRKQMYNNVLLAGGSTLFDGFARRLKEDLTRVVNQRVEQNYKQIQARLSKSESVAEQQIDINVQHNKNRQYASYIGGSIVASNNNFLSGCVSKAAYDEYGSNIMIKYNLIRNT